MGFRRLVVHVGAPKTASTAIQQGLYTNRQTLAELGVHLPETGRLELESRGIGHHHLAWEIHRPRQFSPRQGGWADLAAELAGVEAETVLLSSEAFLRAMLPAHRDDFAQRLRALSDEVVLVVCVREQLSLINSMYGQGVKMLWGLPPFEQYVEDQLSGGTVDFDALFSPWHRTAGTTVRAVPFGGPGSPHPLVGLLSAAGIEPTADLDLSLPHANPSLGPVGVEACLLLTRHLRGRFPDFDPFSLPGRKVHRVAGRTARESGWCEEPHWGWTPDLAEDVARRLAPANHRFAQAVWGHDWPLAHPVDRPPQVAAFEDLAAPQVHRVSRFVLTMADQFAQLRSVPE